MITEEWTIQVGREKYIVSGAEMKLILHAGDARFVQLKDLIVNPAFVSSMVFLRKINNNQLEEGEKVEDKPTQEEIGRAEKVKQEIREKLKRF